MQPSIICIPNWPQEGQAGPRGASPTAMTWALGSDFRPSPSPSMKPMAIIWRSITPPMAARIDGIYRPPIQAPPNATSVTVNRQGEVFATTPGTLEPQRIGQVEVERVEHDAPAWTEVPQA